ncbi:nodulation protein NopC [Mesorhizobium neociceri]|uniref:Nodulation protein NopC n=1 Tax=Mesorhizobium neociceri TaxID=1307853 RepID=A0A838B8Y4_9HYPH|nr:nodulation protein NopC [Mesorhizobium neociceri]MBA1142431.1 nodulation protein NopC [Mesorhizobium neociceri]
MVAGIGSFGSFGASLAHGRSSGKTPHAHGGSSDPKKPVDHNKPADPDKPADPNKPVKGRDRTDIPSDSGDGPQAVEEAFQLALSAVAWTVMNDVMSDADESMADTEEDT